MKMQTVLHYPTCAKFLAINNSASCIYIPLLLFWLYLTDSFYDIGHFKNTFLQWILLAAEIVKYFVFTHFTKKQETRRHESKKFKAQSLFRAALAILGVVAGYQAVAVLFGAPFFSKQQETFTFALTMAILTVIPACLHLGVDKSISLLLSLLSQTTDDFYKYFLTIIQTTCFGAWFGAVVIPLDWNKPYQVWPIPCILGALMGYVAGNLLLLVSYVLQRKSKKTLRAEC